MFKDNRGFTLIEMLVAMVIILVLLLGLVQAALLSIDNNLRNLLRDEAVKIAEQRINGIIVDKSNNVYEGFRNIPFDNLTATGWTCTASLVSRNFRNIVKDYNVCWQISSPSADLRRIDVAVGWNHKNEGPLLVPTNREFQHSAPYIVRRPL